MAEGIGPDEQLDPEGPGPEDLADLGTDETTDVAPCPACGAEIYEDADRCPRCGEYISRGAAPRWPWWMLAGGLAALAAVLWWLIA